MVFRGWALLGWQAFGIVVVVVVVVVVVGVGIGVAASFGIEVGIEEEQLRNKSSEE